MIGSARLASVCLNPIEQTLALFGLQNVESSVSFMFNPSFGTDPSKRPYLYIPGIGWTDAYSELTTGTMANTGVVSSGTFHYDEPAGVVERFTITWANDGSPAVAFSIGFNRSLTADERTALGQASFWAQLFAGTDIDPADCSSGVDYYVDATAGNDSNSGLTTALPWKTLSKVNAASFTPGDRIHLKRGEVWRETLTVPASGLTIDDYGTGDQPEINGALVLKGEWSPSWELLGNPNFESWNSATVPGSWSLNKAGTSTVLRESSAVKDGNFALKMSIDASNSSVDINQISAAGANATEYVFKIWHKIPVGKSAMFWIRSQASAKYLRLDGSWGSVQDHTLTGTGEWTEATVTFTSENPTTTFRIYVYSVSGASSDLYFDKISLRPTTPPAADNIWTYYTYLAVSRIYFDGVVGTKVDAVGDLSEAGEWCLSGSNIKIYSETEPSATWVSPGIEKAYRSSGVVIDTNGVTLDSIHLSKAYNYNVFGGSAIGANPVEAKVLNCTIDYCEYIGVQIGAKGLGHADRWLVRGNTINLNGSRLHDPGDHSIYISHSCENTIEDNTITGNGLGWAVQIQDASNDNIVRRNIMTDNYGGAVVIYNNGDGMPTRNLIYDNLSIRGGVSAVFNVAGPGTAMVTNSFYHNTVVDALNIAFNVGVNAGTILKDNIVWNSTGANLRINAGVTDVTSDYNLFGPEGAGFITYNGSSYATLADYQAASGLDPNSLKDNPMFVGGGDYSLQPGSPAISAGIALPGITTDILGNPFAATPAVGAFEG